LSAAFKLVRLGFVSAGCMLHTFYACCCSCWPFQFRLAPFKDNLIIQPYFRRLFAHTACTSASGFRRPTSGMPPRPLLSLSLAHSELH